MGGHYPLKPEVSSLLIKTALERRAYVAWHAGTSEHGSNIEGMKEAVEMADGYPLHLAHINAYCRGAVRPELEETLQAIDLLKKNPNIFCESYISPKNGTRLTCFPDGKIQSKVTGNCLRRFGFTEDADGVRKALLAGKAFVVYDAGGYSDLMTGEEALKRWEAAGTDVGGSFNVNPRFRESCLPKSSAMTAVLLWTQFPRTAAAFRATSSSRRAVLVKLDVLTLTEFAQKTSLNPARMLRQNKGHLSVGADADMTVYDYATQEPKASFVAGRKVLWDGKVVAKGATVICTERGQKAIQARGMKAIVVDPGKQVERVKAL